MTNLKRLAGGDWALNRAPMREDKTCSDCGRELAATELIYRMRVPVGEHGALFWAAVCQFCAPDCNWCVPEPCGCCGRPVQYPRYIRNRLHAFCDHVCEYRYCNNVRKEQRKMARGGKVCEVRGETFEPSRADAKTCSPQCRQKAYRRRVTDNNQPRTALLNSRNDASLRPLETSP